MKLELMMSQSQCPWSNCTKISFGVLFRQVQVHKPFVYPHILRNKCLEMKDLFTAHLAPVFIECRPFDNLWLQCLIRLWYQLPCKRFDDCRRVNAVRQKIVERRADL